MRGGAGPAACPGVRVGAGRGAGAGARILERGAGVRCGRKPRRPREPGLVLADGALLPLPKDPSKIRRPAAVVSRTEVRFSSVPSKRDFGTPRFHARVIQRWANPTWPLHSAELIVKEGCAIASGLRGARERNYRLL